MLNYLLCILGGVTIFLGLIHNTPVQAFAKTWCVAKPSSSYESLDNVESYACNYVDCSLIHSGDPCFASSNKFNRASFAMNAYYQQEHDCKFDGYGVKSITDLGYGGCNFEGSEDIISAPAAPKWCIAKPTAPESLLQMNIDFACSNVDCSIIQTGGGCQLVDTIMNHASVAMNLFYQAFDRTDLSCHFKSTGMIVTEDPSFGTCVYERKGDEGDPGVGVGVPAVSHVTKHGNSVLQALFRKVPAVIVGGLMTVVASVVITVRWHRRRPAQAIKVEIEDMQNVAL